MSRHNGYRQVVPKPERCDFYDHDVSNAHSKRDRDPGADSLGCRRLLVRADVSTNTHDQRSEEKGEERREKQQWERQVQATIQADRALCAGEGAIIERPAGQ